MTSMRFNCSSSKVSACVCAAETPGKWVTKSPVPGQRSTAARNVHMAEVYAARHEERSHV
jgi:hypothetical protein